MSVKIYVEGGGDQRTTLTKCREGFARYCAQLAPEDRIWSIVACGSREKAFRRFMLAVTNCAEGETYVLLVDSESPVSADSTIAHLKDSDGWKFPPLTHHRVFLMVQAMEAWFLADREELAAFYDGGFRPNALRGSETNIEVIPKDDVASSLKSATAQTKTKAEYHKTKHGFDLLGRIEAAKVERASKHAKDFHDFLRGI